MRSRTLVAMITILLAATADSAAQERQSHWGVGGSFVPLWKALPELAFLWMADPEGLKDYKGSEFRLGVVRGSDLGGDSGVSLVRKKVRKGSVIDDSQVVLFDDGDSVRRGVLYTTNDVTMIGIEIHKFTPFGTIKERVQLGLSYGGGLASYRGRMTARSFALVDGPPPNFATTSIETVYDVEAKEIFELKFVPLGRVEGAVAVLVAPGLKLRATGGFNFPGPQVFGITVNYLIGAHR